MSIEQIIVELKKLNRNDNYRAVQTLIADLAEEELIPLSATNVYEVFTPYDNDAAAKILTEYLSTAKPDNY